MGFKPTELMPEVSCLCSATGTSREAAQDDIPLPPITFKHEAIYLMKMYCKLITVSRGISPWVVLPLLCFGVLDIAFKIGGMSCFNGGLCSMYLPAGVIVH